MYNAMYSLSLLGKEKMADYSHFVESVVLFLISCCKISPTVTIFFFRAFVFFPFIFFLIFVTTFILQLSLIQNVRDWRVGLPVVTALTADL